MLFGLATNQLNGRRRFADGFSLLLRKQCAQALDFVLQRFELGSAWSSGLFGRGLVLGTGGIEGTEEAHGTLHHGDVLAAHLFQAWRQQVAHRLVHGLAHLFLLTGDGGHGVFEVARNHAAQAVAVEADELAQERGGKKSPALAFLFDDNLR